jgi:hypothetical protein
MHVPKPKIRFWLGTGRNYHIEGIESSMQPLRPAWFRDVGL